MGALPHQNVIGSHQQAFELCWTGVYGCFTGGEKVGFASAFLSDDLFLQISDGFGILPMEQLSLGGPPSLNIPDGCRTGGFSFPDGAGMGSLGFLDSLDIGNLCFLDG